MFIYKYIASRLLYSWIMLLNIDKLMIIFYFLKVYLIYYEFYNVSKQNVQKSSINFKDH